MEGLTQLGRRLGEALGTVRGAHAALATVADLPGGDGHRDLIARLRDEKATLAGRVDRSLDGLGPTATLVRDRAADLERAVSDTRAAFLAQDATVLDGFALMAMLEARQLIQWELLRALAAEAEDDQLAEVVDQAVPMHQRHQEAVRQAALLLAGDQDPGASG